MFAACPGTREGCALMSAQPTLSRRERVDHWSACGACGQGGAGYAASVACERGKLDRMLPVGEGCSCRGRGPEADTALDVFRLQHCRTTPLLSRVILVRRSASV